MMQYPLKEKIGHPDLFVGRSREFKNFNQWLEKMPQELSKSRVILARRKSGKTVFVQRLFNQLWSANGQIVPFYFSVPETKMWLGNFAIRYYRTFASQYISFLERNPELVRQPLSLEKIKKYAEEKNLMLFVDDVELLLKQGNNHDAMWETAYSAPHRYASVYDRRVVVIIDEFQYLTQFVYPDQLFQAPVIESMPGSFHEVVESKVAPMLVTGSYISWLLEICMRYLEAGRLTKWYMSPYLPPDEGLQAVYKYAELNGEPVTNETAVLINQLCLSDPFFISCVIQSFYEGRVLDTTEGVINTVNYEITFRKSELSETWKEYIEMTLPKINDIHSKKILLHLSKYNQREWTPRELKQELQLDMPLEKIQEKLHLMVESDLIMQGSADIDYQGLQDGTLYLVLRHRFEKEIATFAPDFRHDFQLELAALKKDKQRLQGMLNQLSGKMAEYQLATHFRSHKRFALSDYFRGVQDETRLNIIEVKLRVILQRADGKALELDVVAESDCGRVVLVEVKKWQRPVGAEVMTDFWEKVQLYQQQHPDQLVLAAVLSLGGFTAEALAAGEAHGIGLTEQIEWV